MLRRVGNALVSSVMFLKYVCVAAWEMYVLYLEKWEFMEPAFWPRENVRSKVKYLHHFMYLLWKIHTWGLLAYYVFEIWLYAYRCIDDMEKHLEETVLSKLPDNYQSARRQSIISEEDDMGTELHFQLITLKYIYSVCILLVSVCISSGTLSESSVALLIINEVLVFYIIYSEV